MKRGMIGYVAQEEKAGWWDRADRSYKICLQKLYYTEHLVIVADFIRDINILPLSCCIVFTKLFVKLLDTLMQGIMTAAWSKRLVLLVASEFKKKSGKRLDVINVFLPSKFPLLYGFGILFVLFVLLFSFLGSTFILLFNFHLTTFFIYILINLFLSVSHSCVFFSLYLPHFFLL